MRRWPIQNEKVSAKSTEKIYRKNSPKRIGKLLDSVEKNSHKFCWNIESILVRFTVLALFLYGLWRVVKLLFNSHA